MADVSCDKKNRFFFHTNEKIVLKYAANWRVFVFFNFRGGMLSLLSKFDSGQRESVHYANEIIA